MLAGRRLYYVIADCVIADRENRDALSAQMNLHLPCRDPGDDPRQSCILTWGSKKPYSSHFDLEEVLAANKHGTMTLWRCVRDLATRRRGFASSARRLEIRDLAELPARIYPGVKGMH